MKCKWIFAAAAVIVSLIPLGAAAQGPQGVGAAEAAQSSNSQHSLNPIKWVKKDPHTETASLNASSDQYAKLTSKLQTQGLLPAGANLKGTCSTIKELSDCVAALHAGHNLGLDWGCLKSKLSGVQTSLVTAGSCTSGTDGKPVTLTKAIHAFLPDANAKVEAKKAERQARADFSDTGIDMKRVAATTSE